MSFTTRNPMRWLGACPTSGGVDDGSFLDRIGGTKTAGVYSGGLAPTGFGGVNVAAANGHVLLATGQGRLNTVLPHQAISGVQITFYDSAVVALSGVALYAASGMPVVGVVNPNSFYAPNTLGGPLVVRFDCQFTSGLCASVASGAPGFTATWTPAIPASGAVTNNG